MSTIFHKVKHSVQSCIPVSISFTKWLPPKDKMAANFRRFLHSLYSCYDLLPSVTTNAEAYQDVQLLQSDIPCDKLELPEPDEYRQLPGQKRAVSPARSSSPAGSPGLVRRNKEEDGDGRLQPKIEIEKQPLKKVGRCNSIQFNSIQFNSIQFNSINSTQFSSTQFKM